MNITAKKENRSEAVRPRFTPPSGSATVVRLTLSGLRPTPRPTVDTPDIELPELEIVLQRARAARRAYLRYLLQSIARAIGDWFARRECDSLDRYFRQSQSMTELESRMRRFNAGFNTGCRWPFNGIELDNE
jgi:hypothetical protein